MSTSLAAWIGLAFVGGGTIGSAVTGAVIDKWRAYRAVLCVGGAGALAGKEFFSRRQYFLSLT